jgi:hypothetical protein
MPQYIYKFSELAQLIGVVEEVVLFQSGIGAWTTMVQLIDIVDSHGPLSRHINYNTIKFLQS